MPPEPPPAAPPLLCRRCGDEIVPGEAFCSSCGFAFGLDDGVAKPARRRKDRGPGALVLLPAVLGIIAVVVIAVIRLAGEDPAPTPTTATTAPATGSTVPGTGATTTVGGVALTGFVDVTDDSGRVSVSLPEAWSDVSGAAWVRDDAQLGPAVSAAVDRELWNSGWATPGLFLGVDEVTGISAAAALDAADFSGDCRLASREPYDDGVYIGEIEFYEDCGDAGSRFVQIAAGPGDGAFLGFLQIVLLGPDSDRILEEIIATWTVVRAG